MGEPAKCPIILETLPLNGDISIADQFNNRAFIIDPVKSDPQSSPIDFQYGHLNVVGNTYSTAYTAFVIGDYTGQTPPSFFWLGGF